MDSVRTTNITFDSNELHELDEILKREWIVTNGIGGYASASIAGTNTRRYHGLLVAALNPPLGHAVLLSKLEETLTVKLAEGSQIESFLLSTNLYPGTVYPNGYKNLFHWSLLPIPTWIWELPHGVQLEKRIWMERGSNSTRIVYRLLSAPVGANVSLQLTPLTAWKDYHSEMHAQDSIPHSEWNPETGLLRIHTPGVPGITTSMQNLNLFLSEENGQLLTDLKYEENPAWYFRFQHPREQERGQDFEEDLFSPGEFSVPITGGGSISVLASSEENISKVISQESWALLQNRQNSLIQNAGMHDDFGKLLALAADQFVVQVPGKRSTIIAGYPWFGDWGRDTMIALPGLCLSTGRAEIAREILHSFADSVSEGMLPNRFPDSGESPEYNTVDATLWYFVAIYKYVSQTGDKDTLRQIFWPVLQKIIKHHKQGTRYNIHEDIADGLIYAGEPGVQLTWMDAKVGDWVVTPRIGKPVEINALWYCALCIMAHFADLLEIRDVNSPYSVWAERTKQIFLNRYARPDGMGLYDVLDTPNSSEPDASIRPNQIFALSLPFAPIAADNPLALQILNTLHSELWTYCGMRTLSPKDADYKSRYEGDQWHRDGAYHQGTAWTWLLGPFVEAHFKVYGDKAAALALLQPLQEHLSEYGIGSIAEILDGSLPQRPNGCTAQAWSVAETLRVWKMIISAHQ